MGWVLSLLRVLAQLKTKEPLLGGFSHNFVTLQSWTEAFLLLVPGMRVLTIAYLCTYTYIT